MKTRNLLQASIAIVTLAFCIYNCGSSIKTLQNNTVHALIDSIDEKEEVPKKADIYIDASASMKGYFISDNPSFSGQLANLVGMIPNKRVFFVDDSIPHTGLMTNLISDVIRQPNDPVSPFDRLLANLCRKVEPGKVMFLVSDGIMSIGKSTPKALQELGYAVRDSLKGFDGAIAIFMFESEFKSDMNYRSSPREKAKRICYFNKNDVPIALNVEKRPYYVFAVGTKDNIRALRKNDLGAKREIFFGIHDHKGHTTNTQSEDINSQLDVSDGDVILNATLPNCMVKLGKDFFEKNTEVYLNDDKKVNPSAYKKRVIDEGGDINIVISQNAQMGQPLFANPMTGNVEFTIKVRNEIPEVWTKLNSDDDSNIGNNPEEQQKTYGLGTLLKGIKEALDSDDYLMELQFIFNQ